MPASSDLDSLSLKEDPSPTEQNIKRRKISKVSTHFERYFGFVSVAVTVTFSDFYPDFHSEISLIVRESIFIIHVHSRLGSEYVVSISQSHMQPDQDFYSD